MFLLPRYQLVGPPQWPTSWLVHRVCGGKGENWFLTLEPFLSLVFGRDHFSTTQINYFSIFKWIDSDSVYSFAQKTTYELHVPKIARTSANILSIYIYMHKYISLSFLIIELFTFRGVNLIYLSSCMERKKMVFHKNPVTPPISLPSNCLIGTQHEAEMQKIKINYLFLLQITFVFISLSVRKLIKNGWHWMRPWKKKFIPNERIFLLDKLNWQTNKPN